MNKYQEALDNIKAIEVESEECLYAGDLCEDDFKTLQELVDKATPKKVDKAFADFTGEYGEKISTNEYCPCCKEEITDVGGHYCPFCGQKLDWSDE